MSTVAEACSRLTEHGEKNRIEIICENHGGPSSNPDALIALMKAVNKPTFGTLPDFGNFPREGRNGKYTIDVYDAIARMMPYAKGVSAKSYDFDDKGRETTLDYARIMKIVTDAKYHGFVGIEYEGGRLSEPEGIKATKKLLDSLQGGSTYQPGRPSIGSFIGAPFVGGRHHRGAGSGLFPAGPLSRPRPVRRR